MIYFQEKKISSEESCPYLPNKSWRSEYFFAGDLNKEELNKLLSKGWRKFAHYYFKPSCFSCHECKPIRIPVAKFKANKKQRRLLRKASEVKIKFSSLEYRDEIYELYKNHSLQRFEKETNVDDFKESFYQKSCPTFQSEYYIKNKLFAVGFLDLSSHALSSIYFIYHSDYNYLSPGTLSILKEIELVKKQGLDYYYLGYYIEENKSMNYKNNFKPYELYDWQLKQWNLIETT